MTAAPALSSPTPASVLSSSPLPELRRLAVYCDDDQVVLAGRVSSYYLKQLAQETVRGVVHGRTLRNRVEVVCR